MWLPPNDLRQHYAGCCDDLEAPPLGVVVVPGEDRVTVGAVYADHRAVLIGRNADGGSADGGSEVPVSLEDLKAVVSNQDLLDLIPR